MFKDLFLLLLLLNLSIFMFVACSNTDNNHVNEYLEEDSHESIDNNNLEMENETATEEIQNNEEDENIDGSNSIQEESLDDQLPEPIEINERIQHKNGVILVLEKITFKEDHILVDFHAQNGRGASIRLAEAGKAQGNNLGGILLEDDTGFSYRYLTDQTDHTISLGINEQATGTLYFMGRIDAEAQAITLTFNPNESEDDPDSRAPKFIFEDIDIIR